MWGRHGMHFSARDLVLDFFFLCKFWNRSHHWKVIIWAKKFFWWIFFGQRCYWDEGEQLCSWWFFDCDWSVGRISTLKWKWWNFVVCFSTNMLWFPNPWGLTTQFLVHMTYNKSITSLYGWDLNSLSSFSSMTLFLKNEFFG